MTLYTIVAGRCPFVAPNIAEMCRAGALSVLCPRRCLRAQSHCRFVLPLIHFTPDSLTYSVPQVPQDRRGGPDGGAAEEGYLAGAGAPRGLKACCAHSISQSPQNPRAPPDPAAYPLTPRVLSPQRDLLCAMLEKDPRRRLSLEQALAHPWCRGG